MWASVASVQEGRAMERLLPSDCMRVEECNRIARTGQVRELGNY